MTTGKFVDERLVLPVRFCREDGADLEIDCVVKNCQVAIAERQHPIECLVLK